MNRPGRCGRIGAMQDTPRDIPAKLPPLPVGNSDWAADEVHECGEGIIVAKYGNRKTKRGIHETCR